MLIFSIVSRTVT